MSSGEAFAYIADVTHLVGGDPALGEVLAGGAVNR
jgi:hypothetical protein